MYLYPKEMRHFRGFKVIVNGKEITHPAYIVGEDGDNYLSFTITHSPKRDKTHANLPLKHNPNPKDKGRSSYLKKHLDIYPKSRYTDDVYENLDMSDEDDRRIRKLIDKRI